MSRPSASARLRAFWWTTTDLQKKDQTENDKMLPQQKNKANKIHIIHPLAAC